MVLLKRCSKSGKFSSRHRTRKGQLSFQLERKAMPKNVQMTIQVSSFHKLKWQCSKSFKLGFSSMWTKNIRCTRAEFKKGRGTRGQIANICWIIEKGREFQKNISFWFTNNTKAFDCVYHNRLQKILQRDENTRSLYLSPEKRICRSISSS